MVQFGAAEACCQRGELPCAVGLDAQQSEFAQPLLGGSHNLIGRFLQCLGEVFALGGVELAGKVCHPVAGTGTGVVGGRAGDVVEQSQRHPVLGRGRRKVELDRCRQSTVGG